MIEGFLLAFFILMTIVLGYAAINSMFKIEKYEDAVSNFYVAVKAILHDARELDNRQMFEKDDDVGILFSELTSLVNTLEGIIPFEETDEEIDEKAQKTKGRT